MPSPGEDKKAGEKTRQKLRDFGLPPEITEKPDLSLAEAYRELNAARDRRREECFGPIPQGDLGMILESEGTMDVVGESHYKPALTQAFLAHAYDDTSAFAWAVLRRDVGNRHDEFAVRVEIDSRPVGFISRDESPEIAEELERIGRPAVCRATISTVDASMFGVTLELDLADFEVIKPRHGSRQAAKPPPAPHDPQPPKPMPIGCMGCLGNIGQGGMFLGLAVAAIILAAATEINPIPIFLAGLIPYGIYLATAKKRR